MKTDPRPKKRLGTGGVCSVLKKFLHPYSLVRNHEGWRTIEMNERVENLLVIGYEERESGRRTCRKKKRSVLFRHDDMPNKEVYCVLITGTFIATVTVASNSISISAPKLEMELLSTTLLKMILQKTEQQKNKRLQQIQQLIY